MSATTDRYLRLTRQFVSFGLVGGSGVLVNLATLALCDNVGRHVFGVSHNDPLIRNLFGSSLNIGYDLLYVWIAFVVAVTSNFLLNRYWTFRHEGQGRKAPILHEYWPFFLTGAAANLATTALFILLTNPRSPGYLPAWFFTDNGPFWTRRIYWGQALAILCTMPINFVVNKLWTFRAVRARHARRGSSRPDAAG